MEADPAGVPPMVRLGSTMTALLGQRQILLSASLLVLFLGHRHGASRAGGDVAMLVHFGLFLLWQPIVRPNHRLGTLDYLLLLVVLAIFLLAMSPGVLAAWVLVLAAIVGGRSFIATSLAGRLPYLIAVVALVLFLVLVVMPAALALAPAELAPFRLISSVGLPLMVATVAVFPVESDFDPQTLGGVDLISALMLFLALAVTLLGALALMQVGGLAYFQSLALAFLAVAAALSFLAWIWHPRVGGGLGLHLSRRMLSSGVSFDNWLHALAGNALAHGEPEAFLRAALEDLRRFPGIVGGRWQCEASRSRGSFGGPGRVVEVFTHSGLRVELAFARPPGEGLLWHYNLMLLVLAEFYRERCQTRLLQLRSIEEAVHETGARLTHDVKNLLQSLHALIFAAARPQGDAAELQRLFQRQLPQIAARLEVTLEKLRRPEEAQLSMVGMVDWWREARARYEGQGVEFAGELGGAAARVPAELYDTCLDNLLQNAIAKRQLEPGIAIRVVLDAGGRLGVSDSGSAIDERVAATLMDHPLRSDQGLGMGLYQAARLARRAGHRLELCGNRDGAVAFSLYPVTGTAASGSDSPAG